MDIILEVQRMWVGIHFVDVDNKRNWNVAIISKSFGKQNSYVIFKKTIKSILVFEILHYNFKSVIFHAFLMCHYFQAL